LAKEASVQLMGGYGKGIGSDVPGGQRACTL